MLNTHQLRRNAALNGLPAVATLRTAAVALLIMAGWRAIHDFGPYQGPVAFVGMVSTEGPPLVLLSSWPKAALITRFGVSALAFGALMLALLE